MRVISVILMIFTLPLMLLIAVNVPWNDPILAIPAGLLIPFPILIIFFYLMNASFGHLRIGDEGILVKKILGSRLLRWDDIATIRYETHLEVVHGAPSVEHSIKLVLRNGKTYIIQSTYDGAAYDHIMREAGTRNLLADK